MKKGSSFNLDIVEGPIFLKVWEFVRLFYFKTRSSKRLTGHVENDLNLGGAVFRCRDLDALSWDKILFKPTLAAEDQFRGTFDEALSYFIGTEGTEDGGFAIAPYTAVRWENEGTIIDEDSAMAMGNYYFTNTEGNETKVEYTFGYTRNEAGELVINLHHSSLPFSAE